MTLSDPRGYQVGALYRRTVRSYHRYYGAPIRETRGLLESVFYLDRGSNRDLRVIAAIEELSASIEAAESARWFEGHEVLKSQQRRTIAQAQARLDRGSWLRSKLSRIAPRRASTASTSSSSKRKK